MTLKTLEDLQVELEWPYDTLVGLKAEAIKWVKDWGADWSFDLFKHFFNITEEDLT